MSSLFTPVRLGEFTLISRIVMAPMTRSRSPGGIPTALNAEYDAQRAGAVLIVTGGSSPAPEGLGCTAIPGLPLRLERGLPLAQADRATFDGGDARSDTDYPAAA